MAAADSPSDSVWHDLALVAIGAMFVFPVYLSARRCLLDIRNLRRQVKEETILVKALCDEVQKLPRYPVKELDASISPRFYADCNEAQMLLDNEFLLEIAYRILRDCAHILDQKVPYKFWKLTARRNDLQQLKRQVQYVLDHAPRQAHTEDDTSAISEATRRREKLGAMLDKAVQAHLPVKDFLSSITELDILLLRIQSALAHNEGKLARGLSKIAHTDMAAIESGLEQLFMLTKGLQANIAKVGLIIHNLRSASQDPMISVQLDHAHSGLATAAQLLELGYYQGPSELVKSLLLFLADVEAQIMTAKQNGS